MAQQDEKDKPIELDVWRRLRDGNDWNVVSQELDARIDSLLQALRTEQDIPKIREIQARISCYSELKDFPDSVLDREE